MRKYVGADTRPTGEKFPSRAVILTGELQLTKLRSGNYAADIQGGVMTREVRLLTPIFAIVAIIAVNLPMRTLAYEAAKLPAVSNEVLNHGNFRGSKKVPAS